MSNCSDISSWLIFYKHKIPYAAILIIFSFIAIVLNLTLIVSFIATRQVTKNTSNVLIFALSISDLATGVVSLPLRANVLLTFPTSDFCIKSKVLIISSGNGQYSVLLTVLLAVDRYLHMNPNIQNRPSLMRKILKKPNVYYLIISLLFCANLLSFSIAFEFDTKLTITTANALTSLLAIQLTIIAFLYTRGYLRVRKFTNTNPVYNESVGSKNTAPDYVRRLYKTVLIIVSLAFIQYIPYCIMSILAAVYGDFMKLSSSTTFAYFFEFATLSTYAGTFTNCLAILYFNNAAKNWILRQTGIQRTFEQSRQI